jgi:hypothetical protein
MITKKIAMLFCLIGGLVMDPMANTNGADVTVTVNRTTPAGTSQYYSSFSQVDNSLDYPYGSSNGAAVTNARTLMAQGIAFANNPIMAWGTADPWPDPTTANPTNWASLDQQMQNITNAGCTPMLTLCEAPWWMKGQYQANGSTMLIPNINGEWSSYSNSGTYTDFRGLSYTNYTSPDPYSCRIIDGQMTNWLQLVQRVAERYMAPPYNVRYFQVWNELKGYYNPSLNHWDYNNSAGITSGYHAQHGYTYIYNQVYQRLTNVAGALGIPASNVYIGGPYPVMDSGSSSSVMSNPSQVSGPWGVLDQRELDVVSYWLTNNVGAGFVCVDGENYNTFGTVIANPFIRCQKFSAVNNWIRQQPGGSTLPIVWSEWYSDCTVSGDNDYANAVGAYGAIQQLESGATLTLLWGAQYSSATRPPLWSSTSQSGGGQATPWYYTYQALNTSFGHGDAYYPITQSSTNVIVLASQTKTLVVNMTTNTFTVSLEATNITLGRYGVAIIPAAVPWSWVQSVGLTNATAVVGIECVPGYPYEVQRGTNVFFTGTLRLWDGTPTASFFSVTDDFSDLGELPSSAFYRLLNNP